MKESQAIAIVRSKYPSANAIFGHVWEPPLNLRKWHVTKMGKISSRSLSGAWDSPQAAWMAAAIAIIAANQDGPRNECQASRRSQMGKLMRTTTIVCDQCGKDLTWTSNCVDYRIVLASETIPSLDGPVTLMSLEPPVETSHFCGLRCLKAFVETCPVS